MELMRFIIIHYQKYIWEFKRCFTGKWYHKSEQKHLVYNNPTWFLPKFRTPPPTGNNSILTHFPVSPQLWHSILSDISCLQCSDWVDVGSRGTALCIVCSSGWPVDGSVGARIVISRAFPAAPSHPVTGHLFFRFYERGKANNNLVDIMHSNISRA